MDKSINRADRFYHLALGFPLSFLAAIALGTGDAGGAIRASTPAGIVNLLNGDGELYNFRRTCICPGNTVSRIRFFCYVGDLIPYRKCLRTHVSVLLRCHTVSLTPESIVDRAMSR
ncbi:hypothetical protein AAKU64_004339 [Undibacterium sp. GrIS 1.8]